MTASCPQKRCASVGHTFANNNIDWRNYMGRNDKYGSVSIFDGVRDMRLASSYHHNTMMATNNNLIHHHHPSPTHETRRYMSKYLSKSATKRLGLNTKRAKKGYYKGKGSTSEGRLTSKGKFIANPLKKLQLIVPDLTGFSLKPYIGRTVSRAPPKADDAKALNQ